ncbi:MULTISPECIES: hypothetical protein [unclassified Streptomyces]|uniref:hypothetical protein n=1 Tax=unclassified Streptomyces TaxID=2593676 RepID=UPI001908BC90|nr:hypothetical protein [Streptomyces sp. HSG2]
MPTPYGSRGGLAFGAEELRVLRRALALALHSSPVSAEDAEDCLRLSVLLDEATRESARLRAFLAADLARYRAALPGAAAGYLTRLDEALASGHLPHADDLAALDRLAAGDHPGAGPLLERCRALVPPAALPRAREAAGVPPARLPEGRPVAFASRTRLLALPGGRSARAATPPDREPSSAPEKEPERRPAPKPAPKPAREPAPRPSPPKRPIPTPGEVFPRRKPDRPAPGGHAGPARLAAG